jgi:hypothetical protein
MGLKFKYKAKEEVPAVVTVATKKGLRPTVVLDMTAKTSRLRAKMCISLGLHKLNRKKCAEWPL